MAGAASTTAAPMAPNAAFGVTGSLKDGVQFLEDLTFVTVASHLVVEKNLSNLKASARFITGTSAMCGVSAIAVSPDRRNLAVAETGSTSSSSPVLNVYAVAKLIKRRSLTSPLAGSNQYVSLCFTCDGKHIAALGGSPEWQLQLWNIMGIKVVGCVKTVTLNSTGAYQVRCCPVDENWLTVCGDGFAKTYKRVDNDLRQVSTEYSNQDGHRVFCHTWIPPLAEIAEEIEGEGKQKGEERKNSQVTRNKGRRKSGKEALVVDCGCVYALDSGELLYVNEGEVIARISMQSSGEEVCVAYAIIPYSKGIVCGESGAISVYEFDTHNRAHKTYRKVRSCKVEETNARVYGLALSAAEDMLLCLLSNNRLIYFAFGDIDDMAADIVSSNVQSQSYHEGFITGMDTCLLKPFAVTCSTDNTVRVWNYEELSCEVLKIFPSEALSVSMHPNGLYLLVGFLDCLCLYDMLINDLRLWKEFSVVKGCTNCAFSHGGQYFAAVSGNSVYIISPYTGHPVGQLRAHLNKVRSIWWAPDDFNIVTAGMDGAIYEWDLKTCKRSREYVIKGCMQTSVIGVNKSNFFLSATSDCKLRELDAVEITQTIESDVNLTQLVQSVDGTLVFAGTEHGAIRAYQYPFTGRFHEVKVFAVSVVKVCLSSDHRLFCASEDGMMVMFDVRTPGLRVARTSTIAWSQEVLISKADLEDYIERVEELETKVVDTEKHCEYEIKYNNEQMAGKIRELEKHYEGLLDEATVKNQSLYMAKAEMELEVDKNRNELHAIHGKLLKDMEEAYSNQILVEVSRYDDVVHRKEADNARWTQEMDTMKQTHELALQELMEAYEAKLEDTQEELQKTKETKAQITLDHEEVRKVVEEDAQNEIEQQREHYEAKLLKADEAIRHIMGKNGLLKSKFMKFQKEVDISYSELNELLIQKKELYEIVNGCQRDIQMLQKDIEAREETLLERDSRIHELKRANQELEKFKWVLDWKIKDLLRSIGPSQIEAAEVKSRMEAMEDELLSAYDKLKDKDLLVTSLKAKLHAANVERKRILFAQSRQAKVLKDFQADFHELSQKIESVRGLKMGMMELYQKHVEGKFKLKKLNKPMHEEFFHQRELLERKVKNLEHELKREKDKSFRSQQHLIKDNQHLLVQTKELRDEVRSRTLTPLSSAPGSRMGSRPTTASDTGRELSSVRKQLAELQLELSARNAHVELLEEQIESGDVGLKQCMGVKKKPLSRR